MAGRGAEIAFEQPAVPDRDAGAGHCVAPATGARAADREFRGPREAGDAAVAERDEMLDGQARAGAVVKPQHVRGDLPVGAIDHHGRNARRGEPLGEGPGVAGRRSQQEAVDTPLDERLQRAGLARHVVVAIAEEYRVVAALAEVLDAARELGEEGIGDVGYHHAQHARLAALQRARDGARRVVELGDRLLDAAARGVAHAPSAVQHVRHGREGHAGASGDVLDGAQRSGPGSRCVVAAITCDRMARSCSRPP